MHFVDLIRRALGACLVGAGLLALAAVPVAAASCPHPEALGVARVLAVDATATPRVGRKHFADTLPLADHEVVLTFDDGPHRGTTEAVLAALGRECVRATFFVLGREAEQNPALLRRIVAEGHTVGNHTYRHPLLDRLKTADAEREIDRGFAAIDTVLHGRAGARPATPFFRFPGFASTPALLDRLAARGIVTFGADLWASDWNPMTPDQQLTLVLQRLDATGGGIILFHDTRRQTAQMLPAFLTALKNNGYKVVHVVPAAAESAPAR